MGNQPGQPGAPNTAAAGGGRPTTASSAGSRPTTAAGGSHAGVAAKQAANTTTGAASTAIGGRPKRAAAAADVTDVPATLATLKYDTPVEFGTLHVRASRSTTTTPSYHHQVWLHVYFSDGNTSDATSAAGVANEQKIVMMNKVVDGRIKANELSLGRVRDWYFIAQLGPLLTDEVRVWCLHPGYQSSMTAGTRFDAAPGRLYQYQSHAVMLLPDNGLMVIDMIHGTIQSVRPAMPDSKTVMWPIDSLIALHRSEAKVDNPYFLDVLGFLPSHVEPWLPSAFTRSLLNIITSYLDDITGQVMEAKTRFPLRLYESVRIACPDLSAGVVGTSGALISPLSITTSASASDYLTLAMHPITTPAQWDKDHCQLLVKVPRTAGGAAFWMDIRKSKVRAIVPVSSSWDANISVECYALELSVTFTEAVTMNMISQASIERLWAVNRDVRWLAGEDAKLLVSPLASSDATSISGQIEHEPLASVVIGDEPSSNSHLWKLPELDLHVFPLQLLPTAYVIKLGAAGPSSSPTSGGGSASSSASASSSSSASRDNGRMYTLTTTKHCKPVSKWPCTRPSCVLCTETSASGAK